LQKRAFINRIRSLFNIDGYTLPELTREQQSAFLRDPVRYLLTTDEAQSYAIMREVENRQKDEADLPSVANVDNAPEQRLAKDAELNVDEKPATAKAARAKKRKPKVEGQTEMLLPIPGGKGRERKPVQANASGRKAG
jgi:hypothetical protein